MNKIDLKLKELKKKKLGLMTHVVVGYPSVLDTVRFVTLMAQKGIDMVELQIPFSDPLADGPTIMRACEKSLENGTKVADAFKVMKKLSQTVSVPLLFMAYYNTVFKYGTERFCKDAREVGASGLIVPDIPIEEEHEEHFLALCGKYKLFPIRVISPVSTDDRLAVNAKVAKGFVYCTARQGITGAKQELDEGLLQYLKKVRGYFSVPLAVGFGISRREHLKALAPHADIAIVGSALIDVINKSNEKSMLRNVETFLDTLII